MKRAKSKKEMMKSSWWSVGMFYSVAWKGPPEL
jgi:hypothetical protein